MENDCLASYLHLIYHIGIHHVTDISRDQLDLHEILISVIWNKTKLNF